MSEPVANPSTSDFDGFRVLHADDALVVVDKAHGLLSVPGIGPEKADCLVVRVARHFPGARIVHRLDRDTSGVIVLARDAETHRALSIQFQERQTSKRYEAIVGGSPPQDCGEVDLPIRKDLDDPPRQIVDFEHGRPSVTKWRVMARGERVGDVLHKGVRDDTSIAEQSNGHPDLAGANALPDPLPCARLELEPITGRGHQLRVHLESIHLPIIGDELYAPGALRPPGLRMLLHATELTFTHPVSGEQLRLRSTPPF